MINHNTFKVIKEDQSVSPETRLDQSPGSEVPVQKLLGRLSGVRQLPSGSWQAICPAHDDHNPSLSISHGSDGRALLKCHAGCETRDVLHVLDLTEADLFPVREAGSNTPSGFKYEIAACYDYTDASGNLVYQIVRFEPKDFRQRRPDGEGGWVWNIQGVPSILYNLPKLLAADPADYIFVPEGEKDVDALTTIGLTATTNSGGANAWRMISDLSAFRDRRVIILPDRDEPGQRHADEIAKSLQGIAKETRLLDLGKIVGFLGNDVSDWLDCLDAKEPDELAEALLEMATASPLWDGAGCPSSAGLFDREDSLLPSFPIEALPSWLGEMVRGTAISKQTPVDLAGTIGLGVLSLACAGRFWVKIKHGWQEPLNLYCSTVLPVACRKTPTYDAMLSPVTEFQKTVKARMSTVIAQSCPI